jgi:hypothetical protein
MRINRSSIFLASLVVAAALSAAIAGAEPAPSWPDTLAGPDWSLVPATPCVRDSVTLTVMGFHDTPCDSFIGVDKLSQSHVRVRSLVRDGYACLVAPIPYPIRMPLGLFAAGAQTIDIEYEIVHLAQGGAATYFEYRHTMVDFQVSSDCPAHGPLPYVHAIVTDPPQPCAQKPTTLILEGVFNDGCGRVIDQSAPGAPLELTIKVATGPDTACTQALVPWRVEFPLGFLAAGNYQVTITLHVIEQDPTGPGLVRRTYYGTHGFFVAASCDPYPTPGPLPYVNSIFVGKPGTCDDARPCPSDSILVRVQGAFPSNCFSFRRIELVPSPIVGPMPEPPIVRIIVDDGGCLGRPCANVPVYWSAAAMLPPLPVRDYQLMVELAQVSCSDTYPPGQLYRTNVPFAVIDSCATPPACLVAGFGRSTAAGACNATVSPGQPAELTFHVGSSVALAGLQGEFKLHPSLLRITKLEAIGPAAGMILNWTATPEGVRFVLFAEHGAPIPPLSPHDMRGPDPGDWPVLRITVEEPSAGEAPERTVITAENLLGSDIDGHGVPLCPASPCGPDDPLYPPIGMPRATICSKHACDFNADGLEDVRDLVSMVHCVTGEGSCPPDAGIHFDCDGDSTLTITDVLCCARHILVRPPCPECVIDSSGVRPEPGVAVSFGEPVETSSGVDLPVHIAGSDRLGGAMLTLEAPMDRYDVTGFDGGVIGQWLTLHDVEGGHLMLGMIDVQGGPSRPVVPSRLDFTLHLALKSGQSPGGEVAAVAGEFSGPDGAMLAVTLGRPSQMLPGSARIELSGNRPNPFSAETHFTLQLADAADVEVGIYDLRGRRVASVFRGHLPSGPQEFHWDGRGSDGTPATNGVYFYRVVAGGRTVARKLILMRGN